MLLREFTVYVNKSEHIKGVIRIRKSKNREHNGQKKKDKQRSLKHDTEKPRIEQHIPH
jgi:hypothetical protein